MSDCCDDADGVQELALKCAMNVRRAGLKANGTCYNCGEECRGVFCDADCGYDFNQQSWAKTQRGK
jgi:hypothetical protein